MSTFDRYDPLHLDQYDYKLELRGLSGVIRRSLWFAAGGDIKILERCPHSERVKYEGIGGVVIATAVLAFFSSFFAMYTVFGPREGLALSVQQQALDLAAVYKSLTVAVIWSLIIFNLDRFIITSTGHGDGTANITWGEIWQGLPRFAMAIVIGLSVSAPLEIRVMKTEIEAALNKQQREYVESRKTVINDEISQKKLFIEQQRSEVSEKIKTLDEQLDKKNLEIENKRAQITKEKTDPKTRGLGPIYASLQKDLEILLSEKQNIENNLSPKKQQLEIERKELINELDNLIRARDQKIHEAELESLNIDGLSTRIKIAHEIAPVVAISLSALLVIIEITPILIKMMLISGPYDYLTNNQNEIVLAKYGIESKIIAHSDSPHSKPTFEYVYHQAKTIENHVVGNLEVESQLAEKAREIFKDRISDDMTKDPEKYMPGIHVPEKL